jgi:hypothetical protein
MVTQPLSSMIILRSILGSATGFIIRLTVANGFDASSIHALDTLFLHVLLEWIVSTNGFTERLWSIISLAERESL